MSYEYGGVGGGGGGGVIFNESPCGNPSYRVFGLIRGEIYYFFLKILIICGEIRDEKYLNFEEIDIRWFSSIANVHISLWLR